jgi:hypothetical protein
MTDFFRDQLSAVTESGALLGSYDVYNQNYVLSIQPTGRFINDQTFKTITWDERNKGWTSFYTYKPDIMFSVRSQFYSTKLAKEVSGLYTHYTNEDRNNFYGRKIPSSVQFVFNPGPSQIKTFKTINYEGSNGWEVTSLVSDSTGQNASVTPAGGWLSNFDSATVPVTNPVTPDTYTKIYSYDEGLYSEDGISYRAGFDRKQNKYYAVIPNNTQTPQAGEVIFGNQTMGIKAYYATITMKTDTRTNNGGPKSLFAVSSEFIQK